MNVRKEILIMGLEDIKAIAAKLFQTAEMKANWQDESEEVGNKVLDSETAKSIFCESIQQAVPNLAQSDKQWLEDTYGVHFSSLPTFVIDLTDDSLVGVNARRSTDINITININIDVVVNACNGSETDLQQLVNMIIAEMTKEDGDVSKFIIALIQAYGSSDQLDFSSITNLLNTLKDMLEQQGKDISQLQQSMDNLGKYLKEQFKTLFKTLERYAQKFGMDISKLTGLLNNLNNNDTKILQKLGEIYSAILRLTNMFTEFTGVEKERYDKIMEVIGDISGDTDTILTKLGLMQTLLESIQTDVTTTKTNSQSLIELVQQGNTAILNAIAQINVFTDPEIKQMLNSILTNMVTKGDLDSQLKKFSEIIENLQSKLGEQIDKNTQEIISKITTAISNITIPEGYDDTALMQMLTDILNKMLTKEDLENSLASQTEQFEQIIANMQNAIETVVKTGDQELIEKMNKVIELINGLTFPEGFDDSAIMAKLTEILNKMVTKEDLDNQLTKIQEMINNLQDALKEAIASGNQNVIDTISSAISSGNENVINAVTMVVKTGNEALMQKAGEIIELINGLNFPGGYDDTALMEMLANIFNNMLTKDDLSNLATKDDLDEGFAAQLDNFKLLIEGLQNNITKVVEKYGDDIGKKIDKVIELINGLSFPGGFDDSAIMAKLTEILNNMLTRDDLNDLATKDDLETQLNKFQQIINALENSVKNCVDAAKKEIIEALAQEIANIEFPPGYDDTNIRLALAEILEKMATKDDLNLSVEELKNFINNVKDDINKTIEENAAQPVDLSVIEALLNQIKALAEGNSAKIDGVLDNQNTIIAMLEGFKTALEGIQADIDGLEDGIQEIKDLINGLDFHCDCDPSKITELLGYIIEIKQIVISLTDNNEGILAASRAAEAPEAHEEPVQRLRVLVQKVKALLQGDSTGVGRVNTNNADKLNGKITLKDTGKLYIVNNNAVYTADGKPVTGSEAKKVLDILRAQKAKEQGNW